MELHGVEPLVAARRVMDYSNAYLGDDKCPEIVDAVRRAPYPVQLDLRGNRFEAAGAKLLADMLKSPHGVVSLSLEWNNIGVLDEGVEALANALEVDTRLLELDLRNNNISADGAKAVAKALKRNRTLRKLDLRWNEVGNAGALAFLDTLQSNHTLITLELTGNNSSLKHAEEIERLLTRNRSIQGQHGASDKEDEPQAASPPRPMKGAGQTDQLLLQVLADKDGLETDLAIAKRHNVKLTETIEDLEMQVELLKKELDAVKHDRDRYQQRELTAKGETHEVRMRLEEMENRRRVEFEEYRVARTGLERECHVMRDKMTHLESLQQKTEDQRGLQIAQLEELKYKLESDVHRLELAATSQQEDYAKVKKELSDANKEFERKEQRLTAAHKADTASLERQFEQSMSALQSQASFSSDQLESTKQALAAIKDKHDTLQTVLLHERVAHEKQIQEIKAQCERDLSERMQRSLSAVEAQIEEVKLGRLHLERDVEQHLATILRLRQENVAQQHTHDERLQSLQQELHRQYEELQSRQDELRDTKKESVKMSEKVQQYARQVEDLERTAARMKDSYEERLRDVAATHEASTAQLRAVVQEKSDCVAKLESHVLRVERALSQQNHEHEERYDRLAVAVGEFVQDQVRREHERRTRAPAASHRSPTDPTKDGSKTQLDGHRQEDAR